MASFRTHQQWSRVEHSSSPTQSLLTCLDLLFLVSVASSNEQA
jgi:hypothetical protein